jgi:hypothetical protein
MKKIRMLFAPGSFRFIAALIIVLILAACNQSKMPSKKPVQLITLDPGHFHAALVQNRCTKILTPQSMYMRRKAMI